MESEREPHIQHVAEYKAPDLYLTHCIWHNGYGACPETGVRRVVNGVVDRSSFELVQHSWHDFGAAQEIIIRGHRKGWDALRIANAMEFIRSRPAIMADVKRKAQSRALAGKIVDGIKELITA